MPSQKSHTIDAALVDNIYYAPRVKRYRYKNENNVPGQPITGTFVSRSEVIGLQKKYLTKITSEFVGLAESIARGDIGVYKRAGELLKKIHMSEAIISANGIDKLSNQQLGKIGSVLKKQYYAGKDEFTGKSYGLKHLFKEHQIGKISDKMLKHRLNLYSQSGKISGNIIKDIAAKENGLRQERRRLGATHQHCPECLLYNSYGWVGIGTLPPPMVACRCRTNCKCYKEYR